MPIKFTLNQKLWLGALLIVGAAGIPTGQLVWQNIRESRIEQRNLDNLTAYRLGLQTTNVISNERGISMALISASGADSIAARRLLTAERVRSDQLLTQFDITLHRFRFAMPVDHKARLAQVRRSLALSRARVDRLALLPRATRGSDESEAALQGMINAIESLRPVVDAIGGQTINQDMRMARVVLSARTIEDLRDYAGRGAILLAAPMLERQPLDASRRTRLEQLLGRIDQLHTLLDSQLATYLHVPRIRKAKAEVNLRYFNEAYAKLLETELLCRQASAAKQAAPDQLLRDLHPKVQSLETLREAIVGTASEGIARQRDSAWRKALQTMVLGGAMALVLLWQLLLIRRSLISPLLRARRDIIELARDNTQCSDERRPSGPEMRALFEAIDTLRRHQRRRHALETEREILTAQLRQQAETDGLTGLINRRGLEIQSEQLLARAALLGRPAGLILFDIDYFKQVNDRYGHLVGDQVLRAVAYCVRTLCRTNDVVGRFGGEEFMIVVEGLDLSTLHHVAEKVRNAIAQQPVMVDDQLTLHVTASFGVALSDPQPGPDWPALIERADIALYRAKHLGRNRVEDEPSPDHGESPSPSEGSPSASPRPPA
ncbi:GGDEF domain-containing protein [Chitiniphilus shinanonensis]|uniref:diguanylate cyclase n=1 Tax=Chitiniphilus shinanonensis TaxID=553088 RepID=A0ABQ6BSI2_9NEIS|nr:GGDEF domain-containing protein [Chitiniphilus shinanonensis]GLS04958.1 GGDEF domain-containing protein [Chitiniphilus shinanonensis]